MQPLTTGQAIASLHAALLELCRDFNSGHFTPILESDVAGFIYHRLLTNGCTPNTVYLATRVCGDHARTRKPDLVIGSLRRPEACVSPLLIGELKVFQRWGHSPQQMNRRFEGVLAEDIPSLNDLAPVLKDGRIEVIVDLFATAQSRGYLTGTWGGEKRIHVVASKCREIGASLIWIHPKQDNDHITLEQVV